MFILGFILGLFLFFLATLLGSFITNKRKENNRFNVSQVKCKETIYIEHALAADKICIATCINNDPEQKKILIEIEWIEFENNETYTKKYILKYSSEELKNFYLLNSYRLITVKGEQEENENEQEAILTLKTKLNKLLQEEKYEEAILLKNEIDKLIKPE